MTKRIVCSLALFMTVLFQFPQRIACAQDATPRVTGKPVGDDFQAITDEDIQLMRKDIRSQRKQIIAANLKLTDAEAEKFWPVYEQYISDLVNLNGTKYALIKRYVESGGALTDTEAETSTSQWGGVGQSVAELRKRYIPIFRKVLSPKNAALSYQLDRRVQLLIDLKLASSIPMIEP